MWHTEQRDFAILTAEISKATFGLTPIDYKNFKGLSRESVTSLAANFLAHNS